MVVLRKRAVDHADRDRGARVAGGYEEDADRAEAQHRPEVEDRRQEGGWLGYVPREACLTADIRVLSLVPPWLFLLLTAGLIVGAWLREGRR